MLASLTRRLLSPEPQPLEIITYVQPHQIAFAVTDYTCLPLARPGDVLIATDSPNMVPEEGRWYLMQWVSAPHPHHHNVERVGQTIGIPRLLKDDMWSYQPPNRQAPNGVTYCGDGYFTTEQMGRYIRGPIVGIYRPLPL